MLIAGIAYERDIDDIREAPALDVMGPVHEAGVQLSYSNPFVPHLSGRAWPGGYDLGSQALNDSTLGQFDCVAILTNHGGFNHAGLVATAPLVSTHGITAFGTS